MRGGRKGIKEEMPHKKALSSSSSSRSSSFHWLDLGTSSRGASYHILLVIQRRDEFPTSFSNIVLLTQSPVLVLGLGRKSRAGRLETSTHAVLRLISCLSGLKKASFWGASFVINSTKLLVILCETKGLGQVLRRLIGSVRTALTVCE